MFAGDFTDDVKIVIFVNITEYLMKWQIYLLQ